jgi:ABC-type phosphate/phosphonate transport system substrate-binding protein
LFREISPQMLNVATSTYQKLMQSQLGMDGKVVHLADGMAVAAQLDSGQQHLGIFQGFEFAWAKAKYPNLEPIVVAVPQHRQIQACVIVPAECEAKTVGCFKGCKVALPKACRDHVRLFFYKLQAVESPKADICEIVSTTTTDDTLDDVVDGKYAGALVDAGAFEWFAANKPGRAERLKVLTKSEVFPPGVIACKKGGLDQATLQKCREGLLGADANAQLVLRMMKLKGFEPVPGNYDDLLRKSQKTYPQPAMQPAPIMP